MLFRSPLWLEQVQIIRDRVLPPIVGRLKRAISETEQYTTPAPNQRPLFLAQPQQRALGGALSQARRLRRLVRRR